MTALAPTLQAYFTDRLICQRQVSPNTIASYRDTFRLLADVHDGENRHAARATSP
jgi:site-specific recombinase XerD